MNIICDAGQGAFRLDTPCTSYVMALADGKWLGHVYYGPRLTAEGLDWAHDYWGIDQRPYTPDQFPREEAAFFDRFPMEYPMANTGDFQECCLAVRRGAGLSDCMPEFASCEILPGKPKLDGLPATFGEEADCKPVLLNNREATYFDFDEARLLEIAGKAAELGMELFVLDDGWFENRPTDSGGLGDWTVDRQKLPHGLAGLAERLQALGLQFGLWMEPEMVSMDSRLYREHPDWAIQTGERRPMLCRDQLVLDLSRPEVEEYVWQRIAGTLHSAPISYLKWDMNRPLTNLGSAEQAHRYVLALYRLQQRIVDQFPDLLLENCCSGGGRFDPGILYYSPQIWCSDDTDAVERLSIQQGTAMLYPLSCIGAHVSGCPNHIAGRMTPFHTRGIVAMAGTFGYELDGDRSSPTGIFKESWYGFCVCKPMTRTQKDSRPSRMV